MKAGPLHENNGHLQGGKPPLNFSVDLKNISYIKLCVIYVYEILEVHVFVLPIKSGALLYYNEQNEIKDIVFKSY